MAGIVYTKLINALKSIGVDVSQQQGSNVKRIAPKNKSTATKPGLLASERDRGGNFGTVLEIIKDTHLNSPLVKHFRALVVLALTWLLLVKSEIIESYQLN